MAQITEAGIRDAKATMERGDRSAREKATRQLKSWQLDRSEENIELYMALKAIVKDQGGTGVQKHMMSTWKTVAESSAFAVRKLLVVDRSNAPWLKSFPKIMQNLVDFGSVVGKLPIEINRDSTWLFDPNAQEVARLEGTTMGPGAFEIVLKIGNRKTNKSDWSGPSSSGSALKSVQDERTGVSEQCCCCP